MLGRLLGRRPALMPERHRVGRASFRLAPLRRLPYLVWYVYDTADPAGPVRFIQLLREKQDRTRFDPGDSFSPGRKALLEVEGRARAAQRVEAEFAVERERRRLEAQVARDVALRLASSFR